MGLHLNWELRLPGSLSREEVIVYVRDLHAHALTLGFDETSPLLDRVEPDNIETLRGYFWLWAKIIARPNPELDSTLVGDVPTAVGFGISRRRSLLGNAGHGQDCRRAHTARLRRARTARTAKRRELPNAKRRERQTARTAKRRELPNGANCQTARTAKRRELPNGANCQTARTAKRRELPNGELPNETARTAKRRELPNGANCQTARAAKRRELPNGANCQTARTAKRRELPNGANCQTARTAKQRELPKGARTAVRLLRREFLDVPTIAEHAPALAVGQLGDHTQLLQTGQ